MQNNETFGECLKKFMNILNLKGSVLAKGINVDSSLIYKWLRNERAPSYNSSYIDSISDYFVKCIINSFQKENVIKELSKCGFQISDGELTSILNAIHKCLLEAQGYSIEICINKNIDEKVKAPSRIKNLTKTSNMPQSMMDNACNHALDLPELDISDAPPLDSDNVKIIKGNKEILLSAIALLGSVQSKSDGNDDAILITLNSNITSLQDYAEYNVQWKRALFKALKKGWTVIFLVTLNDDRKKIFSIIEDMQFALAIGKYRIYYKKNDEFAANELLVVPNRGALYCFSSKIKNQVDSAFLFKSEQSIKLLSEHFCQLFSSAKPLLYDCPSQISVEIQHELAEIEEHLGNRCTFRRGISTITIPVDLYEKYLTMSNKPKQETSLRLTYHKRRLEAFETQIKYYKYKDIWLRESIEKLVNEKKYPFDQYCILGNSIPDDIDIVYHLENTVKMLEKYENYEVAIVSMNNYDSISEICWMVKENSNVFIEAFDPYTQKKNNHVYYNSGKNVSIFEKEVINAFQDYFMMIWNEITYYDKQKKEVIKWLKGQIDLLKGRDHK